MTPSSFLSLHSASPSGPNASQNKCDEIARVFALSVQARGDFVECRHLPSVCFFNIIFIIAQSF